MMKKKAGLNKIFLFFFIIIINCYTPPIKKIPIVNYEKLYPKFQTEKPEDFFPVVVQPSSEEDLQITEDGFMVFSSEIQGISDIWLKDLKSIIKIKIIEHPTKQYSPYLKKINENQYYLVYVSNHSDIYGDLMMVNIHPIDIIESYHARNIKLNYWDSSVNLSRFIEETFFSKDYQCRGKFPEIHPFFSEDGKYLFYLSNRCTGKFSLWKLKLNKKGLPEKEPEIVLEEDIIFPYLKKQKIVYNTKHQNSISSIIKVFDLENQNIQEIDTRKYFLHHSIFLKPRFSEDFSRIYGIIISEDTNKNGNLDINDKGQLAYIDLKKEVPITLTNKNYNISNFEVSNFAQGSLFFISDSLQQRDIYFLPTYGIIPEFKIPLQHYLYAQKLKGTKNYFVALQTFLIRFKNQPDFLAFEGEVFYEIFQTEELKDPEEKETYIKLFEERKKENPSLEIFYLIRQQEQLLNQTSKIEKLFQEREDFFNNYPFIKDYYYFRMGELLLNKDQKKSLEYFHKISQQFLLNRKIAFYKFYIQIQNNKIIDEESLKIAIKSKENLKSIFSELENYYFRLTDKQRELLHQSIKIDFLKYHFLFFKSQLFLLKDQIFEAENLLNEIYNFIQSSNQQEYKYLKLILLKNRILVYKKLKKIKELLFTRNEFIITYDKEFKIEIDESEINELIHTTNEYVDRYRNYAIRIYENIENELQRNSNFLAKTIQNIRTLQIDVSYEIKESLREFCEPDSIAKDLIIKYQYLEYINRYNNLCEEMQVYLNRDNFRFPVDLLFEANQLMYLSSYAFTNLINILFIDIYRSGIFQEFYKKWSNFYHRLKVHLAIERFRYNIEWQEKQQLGNISFLIEQDPFEGKIFDDLLYGYRQVASQYAQENFDTSVLYGHAYTLIMKSLEREKFYDSLFLKGLKISNSELIKRKRKILQELKEAEYQLLFILTLEPTNEDALLLLTWLYIYIDTRKEKEISNPPGLIDSLFRFITQTRPSKLTEGIFYRSLYRQWFPFRHYEQNIELLNSYIDIKKYKKENISESIELSLANNYFLLRNYKNALEIYENLEKRIQFEDKEIQSYYLFSYGKASFFENQYKKAIRLFEEVYNYFFHQYLKIQKAINTKIIHYQNTLPFYETGNQISLDLNSKKQIEDLQYKLAVVRLYTALSKFYDKQYTEAIEDFHFALDIAKEIHISKEYNILNFIALSHLQNYDFENAIRYSLDSINLVYNLGLKRNKEYFYPQTVGGRFLGFFINFNEDMFIIGDSRIPYEIPTLESYYISYGILRNIFSEQGNLNKFLEISNKQKQQIKMNFFDVNLGKKIYIHLLNNEGWIYYRQKDYEKSINTFREAYEIASKYNFISEYYINLKNSFHSFLKYLDELLKESKISIELKKDIFNKIIEFKKKLLILKKNYYEQKLNEYINLKKIENPDFKPKETDILILEKSIKKEMMDFEHLEILLNYYTINFINPEDIQALKQIEKNLYNLLNQFNEISFNELYYTIKFNFLIVKFKILSLERDEKELKKVENLLEEFIFQISETGNYEYLFHSLKLSGDFKFLQGDFINALKYYREALKLLETHYYYFTNLFIFDLEERIIYCLIKTHQESKIIEIKEKLRTLYNLSFLFKNKITFKEKELHNLYNSIADKIKILNQIKKREISEKIKGKSQTSTEVQKLEIQIKKDIQNLILKNQIFKELLSDTGLPGKNLKNEFLYLFTIMNHSYCYKISNRKSEIYEIQELYQLENCINSDMVIIPDLKSYYKFGEYLAKISGKYKIVLRTSIKEDYPIFINNISDLEMLQNKNIFNHSSKTFVENSDIIKIDLKDYIFNQLLEKNFTASTISILNRENFTKEIYKIFFIYNLTSSLGASRLIDPYHLNWGTVGYNEKNLSEYKKNLSDKLFSMGLKFLTDAPDKSLPLFNLSFSLYPSTKKKIYILGAMIRTNHPEKDKIYQLIKQELLTRGDKISFFIMVLRSYSYQKDFKKIQSLISDFEKEIPDSKILQRFNNTIKMILELEKNNPDLEMVYHIIKSENFDTAFIPYILRNLYVHSCYDLINKLSEQYDSQNLINIKSKISMELFHSSGNLIRSLITHRNRDKEINNLYNLFFENMNPDSIHHRFIKNLVQYYSNDSEEILCDRTVNCKQLPDLEKKVLFTFFLNLLPYDSSQLIFHNLIKMIESFFEQSCTTGNLYLYKLIETLILNQEFDKAFILYSKYSNKLQCFLNWDESKFYIDFVILNLYILKSLDYKIDNQLILDLFRKTEKAKIYFSDFSKILNLPFNELLLFFNNFNWNFYSEKYHHILYDIFMNRSLKEKKYIEFQNFAILKDQKFKKYVDKINEIQPFLENYQWLSFIEFKEHFYICQNWIDKIDCIQSSENPILLRKQLSRYFLEGLYFKNSISLNQTLISSYLKITSDWLRDKNYIWFSGIHKFHPAIIHKEQFFVMNPLNFKAIKQKNIFNQKNNIQILQNLDKDIYNEIKLLPNIKNLETNHNYLYITSRNYNHAILIDNYSKVNINDHFLEPQKKLINPSFSENGIYILLWNRNTILLQEFLIQYLDPYYTTLNEKLKGYYQFLNQKKRWEGYFLKPYVHSLIE